MSDRSGSENRKRTVQVGLRLTPEESTTLWDLASGMGLTIQEYVLLKALPEKGLQRNPTGQYLYSRLMQEDSDREPDDPLRKPSYEPCCLEHTPGRFCIREIGHDGSI